MTGLHRELFRQAETYILMEEVMEMHNAGKTFEEIQTELEISSGDYTELRKELGDLLWFIAEFCTASGWNMEDIMQMNLDKLEGRYPDGFEVKRSVERPEYIQGTLFEE